MIISDKQYKAAKKQLAMLKKSLSSPVKKGISAGIEQANRAQVQELTDEIQETINEYEAIRNSNPSDVEIHSMDDLMVVPIRYSVTKNNE